MSESVRFAVLFVDSKLKLLQYGIDVGEIQEKNCQTVEELRREVFLLKNQLARDFNLLMYENKYEPNIQAEKQLFLRADILLQHCKKGLIKREE